ncbi:DUF2156 domain-containing protein [Schaalia sp. 19OD2882]|uniref:bifunctional lysylphosphatidylglycerol flippase/synthetase MprF n=1 Tax=Schaalia sp. 19OD2882 TaxID=2794089 RepID=UPI001C1F1F4C|nr:DUF2156 domain-containing protein [Schaalia sp. 19OD2882]QWW20239.1 DUF2156 domain-containing protein [Schaalia sp. 19OD2882]
MSDTAAEPTRPRHRWLTSLSSAGRLLVRCVRGAPAATTLAALALTVGLAGILGHASWYPALHTTADPLARPWVVVTALLWTPTWHQLAVAVLAMVTIGALVEHRLGTGTWTAVAATCSVAALVITQMILLVADSMHWLDQLMTAPPGGIGLVLAAVVAAWGRTLNALARRRVLAVVLLSTLLLAALGGTANAMALFISATLGAFVAGSILRSVLGIRERPLVGTRHEGRTLVALLMSVVSVGSLLALWYTHANGPLASARLGLDPGYLTVESLMDLCERVDLATCAHAIDTLRTTGTAPIALTIMPVFLQLAVAMGLLRGRRSAFWVAVVVESALAVFAFARILVPREDFIFEGNAAIDITFANDLPVGQLVVPVLLPLTTLAVVVWNRRWFRVRSTRRDLVWAGVALATVAVLGSLVAVVGGLMIRSQFVPAATWELLAANYWARLLPPTALFLLTPPLLPSSPAAFLVVNWLPVLVWAGAVAILLRLFTSTPADLQTTASATQNRARDIVRATDAGTLGWMLTWPGNSRWFAPEGRAMIAYRAAHGVGLTLADPAACTTDLAGTVEAFAEHCTEHSLVPALYSVHAPTAALAQRLGWTSVQVAEEALIDLPDLAFTGKKFQDVRTALNRAKTEGIEARWTTWQSAPAGMRDQIRAISNQWVAEKALPEMGFTLGGLTEIKDADTRLLLALDKDGTVHAVTSWLPIHRQGRLIGLTLDVMRRRDCCFRPVVEFLIGRAALDAKEEGLQVLSLSGAPLAHSAPTHGPDGTHSAAAERIEPLLDSLGALLEPVYGFRSLHFFKSKFQPRFEPLYLVVPDVTDLPAVGAAIAKAYLPGLGPVETARFAQKLVTHD